MKNVNRHLILILMAVTLTGVDAWKLKRGESMPPENKTIITKQKSISMNSGREIAATKVKNKDYWIAEEVKKSLRDGEIKKKQKQAYTKKLKEEFNEVNEFDEYEHEQSGKKLKNRVSTAFSDWAQE